MSCEINVNVVNVVEEVVERNPSFVVGRIVKSCLDCSVFTAAFCAGSVKNEVEVDAEINCLIFSACFVLRCDLNGETEVDFEVVFFAYFGISDTRGFLPKSIEECLYVFNTVFRLRFGLRFVFLAASDKCERQNQNENQYENRSDAEFFHNCLLIILPLIANATIRTHIRIMDTFVFIIIL